MKRWRLLTVCLLLAIWLCSPNALQAQAVGPTTVLAPMAGRFYTPAPGQESIGFYATDLGHVVEHAGQLRILFGDTWTSTFDTRIGLWGDDAQGAISLSSFPTGDAVEAYILAHPAAPGQPSWLAEAPPIAFRLNRFGQVAAQKVTQNGVPLEMGLVRAPVAAFSNARDGMFAVFGRNVVVECGAGGTCPAHLSCDTGIGRCWPSFGEISVPCLLGTTRCLCVPAAGGGMCQDPTSSFYDPGSEDGRIMSLAIRQQVGNADPAVHEAYASQPWITNKFVNAAARTVNDFDPARAYGVGNDYQRADGEGSRDSEKVFIWARPFAYVGGIGALGLNAKLYFAYVDMPEYEKSGHFAWSPHYFTGLDPAGAPQFTSDQTDAVPLDLSGGSDPTAEVFDQVLFMSVAWLGFPMDSWVMLYGGGNPPGPLAYWLGPNWSLAEPTPQGAIYARFAPQPWGPWSAPVQLFAGGDPHASPPEGQYAPGGILHHPVCAGADCAPSDRQTITEPEELYGWMYSPYIIDRWTTPRDGGAYDLYWNVSTSNPYQVLLMKTRIEPAPR